MTLTSLFNIKDFLILSLSLLFFLVISSMPVYAIHVYYAYQGSVDFIIYNNSIFIHTGKYIPNARVIIGISRAKGNTIYVSVHITGALEYDPSLANCSGIDINSLLKCTGSAHVRIINSSYHLTLIYRINASNNYAWLDNRFIGFFPLYSIPDIGYRNATKFKYVYLGKELSLLEMHGKPIPVHVKKFYGNHVLDLHCIDYRNTYIEFCLLHHYPLYVWGLLPIGDNKFILLSLNVDDSMLRILISVNNYPSNVTYTDYVGIVTIIAIMALIFVIGYLALRYYRGRKA